MRTDYPSPLPLHVTPRWLRLLGKPKWRFKEFRGDKIVWTYLSKLDYQRLFGK